MFRICGIAFAFLLFLITNSTLAASVSVLFVGNSLIYRNDLPTEFKTLATESALHVAVDVSSITPGGAFLYDHWKRGDALTMLRARHPNFLVLQAQSTEPLSAPKQFNYYAAQFKKEADRIQTKTILFSTWARPSSDPFYKEATSGGSPSEMQKRLNAAYAALAQNIGATLAPIGVAWEQAQHVAPQIQLLDGTQHPSPAGTYLAAAVLFRTIFKSSVVGSTYLGGLPPTIAHTLQRIADATPIANN
jgi:hypothetical protein